ncbi:MAG: propionyl-CoA synthetase, partial [Gammaproteobacteria bacterium]|nr:propionyl-CoA synthetase [Gammaproteobacteria bacterium]
MTDYATLHSASISNPTDFWAKAAEGIEWAQRWDNVLEQKDATTYRWFSGGKLNTCFNALDRHVQGGRANQAAIIYDSPVTDSQRKISYAELLS